MNDVISLEVPLIGPAGYDPLWDDPETAFHYYDKRGNPLTFREYASLKHGLGAKYAVLCQEDVGKYWVSTVWLGMDHGFGTRLLIFETMVFNNETDESDLACERYTTEEEALAGHERMVEEVRLIVAATEEA